MKKIQAHVTRQGAAADYNMTAIIMHPRASGAAANFNHSSFWRSFMNKQTILTMALGSAFAAVTTLPAHAAGNPFAAKTLDAGYQVAQADMKAKDGKCGEAKCGADKKAATKGKDGSCGGAQKAKDGSCGGNKKKDGSSGAKKS